MSQLSFRIPGQRQEAVTIDVDSRRSGTDSSFEEQALDWRSEGPTLDWTVEAEIKVGVSRDSKLFERLMVSSDDVLELEFSNGQMFWLNAESYYDHLAKTQLPRPTRGTVPERNCEVSVPVLVPSGGGSVNRDLVGLVLTRVRHIVVKFAAEKTVDWFVNKLETKLLRGREGLCRWIDPNVPPERLLPGVSGDTPNSERALLFLHGTASTTQGSFGSFGGSEQKAIWKRLRRIYGDNIYAFEHRTLTESPLENTMKLLQQLRETKLHEYSFDIVSHSRGGLIGELLCRAKANPQFDEMDRSFLGGEPLDQTKLTIASFIRVACPARGTTLASGRLDLYLSIFTGASSLAASALKPELKFLFDGLRDITLAVARTRADPASLPGLQAMMPDSKLISFLNRPNRIANVDLTVISGDCEGSITHPVKALGVLLADFFYREENDWIVHSRSMLGGVPRRSGRIRCYFERSASTNHFSYFRNPSTYRLIRDVLDPSASGGEERFQKLSEEERLVWQPNCKRDAEKAPSVVLVPGLMGSHLFSVDSKIWPNWAGLLENGLPSHLVSPAHSLTLEPFIFQEMSKHLAFSHRVVTFPYDWRLSLGSTAELLRAKLEELLEKSEAPVRVLAHGTGGLVVRLALGRDSHRLQRALASRAGSRVIYAGCPHNGSTFVLQLLRGLHPLHELLRLGIDGANRAKDTAACSVVKALQACPGLLETLPMLDISCLEGLKKPEDIVETIGELEEFRPEKDGISLQIFGWDDTVQLKREGEEVASTRHGGLSLTKAGDGRFTWEECIVKDLEDCTYLIPTRHGSLFNDPTAFYGIVDLLTKGATQHLKQWTSQLSNEAPKATERVALQYYPGDKELLELSLHASLQRENQSNPCAVSIEFSHGDLVLSSKTVLVAHYTGQGLWGFEKDLDDELGGSLTRRQKLGLYPEEAMTYRIFWNPDKTVPDTIVLGLGRYGDLTPSIFKGTVQRALTEYCLRVKETCPEEVVADFATPLLGTGGGGLQIQECLASLLEAVHRTNESLGEDRHIRIAGFEIMELFEDKAISGLTAIKALLGQLTTTSHLFTVAPELKRARGGQRRVSAPLPVEEWFKVDVSSKDDKLIFGLSSARARSEQEEVVVQAALVESVLRQSLGQSDERSARQTASLFELLIPNEFKALAYNQVNLLLQVDSRSSQYPWELLHSSRDGDPRPIAIRSGLIRQLKLPDYRAVVNNPIGSDVLIVGCSSVAGFARLEGVEAEVKIVEEMLAGTFTLRKAINLAPEEVLAELFSGSYRVLHLSGHGQHLNDSRTSSGLVLGPDVFLSPAEVRQMREIPELVFINCCHLAKLDLAYHEMAANIAGELIHAGVKAVVAAGWAIDDEAARRFAEIFYERMRAGVTFGEAVRQARQRTWSDFRHTNTWGAYQCYGDPCYRLTSSGKGQKAKFLVEKAVTPVQVYTELDNIAAEAIPAGREKIVSLSDRLDKIASGCPTSWVNGTMLMRLGDTWAVVGELDKARRSYRSGYEIGGEKISIRSIERMIRVCIRTASTLNQLSSAIEVLENLEKLSGAPSRTWERLTIRANGFKRAAELLKGRPKEQDKAIEYAQRAFRQSMQFTENSIEKLSSQLNTLCCHALCLGENKRDALSTVRQEAHQLSVLLEKSRNTQGRLGYAFALLIQWLASPGGTEDGQYTITDPKVLQAYLRAFRKSGFWTSKKRILEHLRFSQISLERLNALRAETLGTVIKALETEYTLVSGEEPTNTAREARLAQIPGGPSLQITNSNDAFWEARQNWRKLCKSTDESAREFVEDGSTLTAVSVASNGRLASQPSKRRRPAR